MNTMTPRARNQSASPATKARAGRRSSCAACGPLSLQAAERKARTMRRMPPAPRRRGCQKRRNAS
eukprot:5637988-Pyramimonas_sp.AAC.1